MRGFQGSLTQLQNEVETLRNLGINTIMTVEINTSQPRPDYDWPGLDVATVQDTLNKAGLKYRGISVYRPLDGYTSMQLYEPPLLPSWGGYDYWPTIMGYFDFYLHFNQQQLNDWAREVTNEAKDSYAGVLSNVVEFHLVDEPGWSYGNNGPPGHNMLDIVNNTTDPHTHQKIYLPLFQNYLSSLPQHFIWTDFNSNATSWNDPNHPIKASGAGTTTGTNPTAQILPQNRLFLWTMRFFSEQASQGMTTAIEALNNAFATCQIDIFANWNNWKGISGIWYQSHVPPSRIK